MEDEAFDLAGSDRLLASTAASGERSGGLEVLGNAEYREFTLTTALEAFAAMVAAGAAVYPMSTVLSLSGSAVSPPGMRSFRTHAAVSPTAPPTSPTATGSVPRLTISPWSSDNRTLCHRALPAINERNRAAGAGLRVCGGSGCSVLTSLYAAKARGPLPRSLRDEELKAAIARVHLENFGVYGVDKVWAQLSLQGVPVARSPG
jgi:hypothetical protein